MDETFQNKYEKEAHEIVEGLRGTRWEAAIGPDQNRTMVSRTPNFVLGLLALAVLAIWRLRR
jgi:hypothetical protein